MSDVLKDEAEVARHYAWFARMWVIAGLFHVVNQISWPSKPWEPTATQVVLELLMVAVGAWVFRRPRQAAPFVAFLVLEFAHGLRDIPRVANHWYITFLMVSAMLASAVSAWNAGPRFTVAGWFRRFAPGARWLLLICYAFAAWAKLNTDFMDPEVSCASTLWRRIGAEWLHGLPQGAVFDQIAIWTTIVVELAVPVALLSTRYRHLVFLLAVPFHYLISFTPVLRVPDFASLLIASWFLFLPPAVPARMSARLQELREVGRWLTPGWAAAGALALHLVVFAGLAASGQFIPSDWFQTLRLNAFTFYGLGVFVLVVLSLRDPAGEVEAMPDALRLRSRVHGALIAVALLSGLSPYLGLRGRANFSMFSNLRTEDHRPNHVLMPQLYLTDDQLDLVEIVSTDIRQVRDETANGYRLAWWELRQYARRFPEAAITWRRNGEERSVTRAADDAELSAPMPLWEPWLLAFRPVDPGGASACQW